MVSYACIQPASQLDAESLDPPLKEAAQQWLALLTCFERASLERRRQSTAHVRASGFRVWGLGFRV